MEILKKRQEKQSTDKNLKTSSDTLSNSNNINK